jgi:hypothetical protein
VSFRELVDAVNRGKTELWRRLYEVPVPPEVIEELRPEYEKSELPPEYWVGLLAYRFTVLDMYTQYELLKPFEEYELFCEELASPPVLSPWLRRDLEGFADEYLLSRQGYYGTAGDIASRAGVSVPPRKLDELENILAHKDVLPLAPADFLHDMREFLIAFFGETWYETTRPGGLIRLGFWAHKRVEEFAGKAETEAAKNWELLDWFGSILMKRPGGPMCRQAVYVWPWLKRWFLETFINLKCDEYRASTVGSVAVEVTDTLLMVEFLTAIAAWGIQRDCISVEKGFWPTAGIFTSPLDGFSEQCTFLRLVYPETRFMELLEECTKPVVDRCDIIAVEYGKRYELTPRMIETLRDDCRKILSILFREPRLLKMFVAYWIYGPIEIWPRLAGEFYRALEEATLIPRWRRWRVFRALREAGEIR